MEILFPLEFIVKGTPLSLGSGRPASREAWKARVRASCASVLPEGHFATDRPVAVSLYYFPDGPSHVDVDNIIKLVLDALKAFVFVDDRQVSRVVSQKFEPGNVFGFSNPSPTLIDAIAGEKPLLYVRISDNPFEDLE